MNECSASLTTLKILGDKKALLFCCLSRPSTAACPGLRCVFGTFMLERTFENALLVQSAYFPDEKTKIQNVKTKQTNKKPKCKQLVGSPTVNLWLNWDITNVVSASETETQTHKDFLWCVKEVWRPGAGCSLHSYQGPLPLLAYGFHPQDRLRSKMAPGVPYSTSGSSLVAELGETIGHILYPFSGAFPEAALSPSDDVSLARTWPMTSPTIMEAAINSVFIVDGNLSSTLPSTEQKFYV